MTGISIDEMSHRAYITGYRLTLNNGVYTIRRNTTTYLSTSDVTAVDSWLRTEERLLHQAKEWGTIT